MVQAGVNGCTKIFQTRYVYPVMLENLGSVRNGAVCMISDVVFKWSVPYSFISIHSTYGSNNVTVINKVKQSRYRPGVSQRVPGS
jgi:hypothetical protein